jgi:hypothetical protein
MAEQLQNFTPTGQELLLRRSKAFIHIRRREVALHREWMIRDFTIGLAVASPLTHLKPHQFFGTAFWVGFTLHLIGRRDLDQLHSPKHPNRSCWLAAGPGLALSDLSHVFLTTSSALPKDFIVTLPT